MTQMSRSNHNRGQGQSRGRDDLERWLNAWMPNSGWEASFADSNWLPPVNIAEDQDNYKIEVELPGVRREDIKVTYNNGVLTIQGERKEMQEQNSQQYHRMERVYGQFERSFRLPMTVKSDQIHAEYNNGVLDLTIPKAEEAKPRQISINVLEGQQSNGGGDMGRMGSGNGGNGGTASGASGGSNESGASSGRESGTWGNQEKSSSSKSKS